MQFRRYLNEKLIVVHGTKGKRYGNVVLLAGGGGSGKGFAVKNFLEGDLYKIRDIDKIKGFFMKIADIKKKYPEIQNLNLKNADDVGKIHKFVADKNIKGRTFDLLMKGAKEGHLPNVLFDITFKGKGANWKWIRMMIDELGYSPKDINLIWVLTNYAVAVKNNAERSRVVPDDIMLATHEGAALNMIKVIKGEFPEIKNKSLFNGSIHVILNNRKNTLYWAGPKATTDDVEKAIKTKPTKAEMELYKDTDGKEGRAPQPVIADFKYLTLKEKGKPLTDNENVLKQVQKWVMDNVPKTVAAHRALK